MIHTRRRDAIRMVSGEVHVVDELHPYQTAEDMPITLREFAKRMERFIGDVEGGFFVAYAFDRMDSIVAGTPVAIVSRNISTVHSLDVQIEAGEDAFSD